jgi:DNA-directed RNA polymerase specialized sigma24 family protein
MSQKDKKFIYVNVKHIPIDEYDDFDSPNYDFSIDFENVIFRLSSSDEISVLLLRYMGYSYLEVIDILEMKDISEYYKVYRRLRENLKKISKESI